MKRWAIAMAVAVAAAGAAPAAVVTREVEYEYGGTKMKGVLAYDTANGGRNPAVLVFPEWWGLNEYAKDRAKQLAGMGYVAFAADLYGNGQVVATAEEAMKLAGGLRADVKAWRGRAAAALKVLTDEPIVDAKRVAAIGYCLGGSTALQLAYAGADLRAVSTFHAALPTPTPEEAKAVKARLLVNHGAADTFIPEKAVAAFKSGLDAAGVKYEFVSFPGVVHSFTVPDAGKANNPGMKYDKAADEVSWKKTQELFQATLGK